MRLMQFIGLRKLLPRQLRARFRDKWNDLLGWEQHLRERQFYRQFIKRNDLVFDVGANRGAKTDALLSLGAQVVAVEPNPVCVEFLRSRYADVLGSGQLQLKEAAVASQPGEIALIVFDGDSDMCSGSPRFLKYADTVGYR